MSASLDNKKTREVLIDQTFFDFGQFESAIEHWNLDFTLLGRGGFSSGLHYSIINNCIFGKAAFHSALEQRGSSPQGMRTFVVPVNNQVSYRWRNHHVTGNTLQLFPKNGELYSVSDSSFNCYIISFPEPLFLEVAESMGHDLHSPAWEQAFVWKVQNPDIRILRKWCALYYNGMVDENDTLLQLLITSLLGNKQLKGESGNHQQIILDSHNLIKDSTGEILKVRDLVQVTGFSERTIQYAFKSIYGISPMDYVKRHRLKAVYSELHKNMSKSIVDIANKYGFWHLGQFAQDFRKVYGCLPSELRKNGNRSNNFQTEGNHSAIITIK